MVSDSDYIDMNVPLTYAVTAIGLPLRPGAMSGETANEVSVTYFKLFTHQPLFGGVEVAKSFRQLFNDEAE